MRPMLATRGHTVPTDGEWLHEIKWDGYRALVEVRSGIVTVHSRTEREVTTALPEFTALRGLPDCHLDAEIVVFEDGRPTLQGVAERFQARNQRAVATLAAARPASLMVFDVLACLGKSTMDRPLSDRRQLLEVLPLEDTGVARVSPAYDDGEALLAAVREQDLEGIVSKRCSSRYQAGLRSADWLKFPLRSVDSFVVGGYRWERGGKRIGALLVGEPSAEGLVYRGRVTLAVRASAERAMANRLAALHRPTPRLIGVPEDDARDAVWVEPIVVIDVDYVARTADGRLRHSTYQGLREDLTVGDLRSLG